MFIKLGATFDAHLVNWNSNFIRLDPHTYIEYVKVEPNTRGAWFVQDYSLVGDSESILCDVTLITVPEAQKIRTDVG